MDEDISMNEEDLLDLHHNFREVKECGISENMVGHAVPNNADMIDAIFFIFPKKLLEHLVFAKLEEQTGLDWDFITRDKIDVVSEFVKTVKNCEEEFVVVHPRFLSGDLLNMNFPSVLRCYGSPIHAGLIFDRKINPTPKFGESWDNWNPENEGKMHIAFQYQRFKDETFRRDFASRKFVLPVVASGVPTQILFMSGMMSLQRSIFISDRLRDKKYAHRIRTNGIPTYKYTDPYSIPFGSREESIRKVNEFDSYVTAEYQEKVRVDRMFLEK
jgi:hypothetical protein